MRIKQKFLVFGFTSTHLALDAEQLLDDMGVDVVPIPAPAAVTALCGLALRVPIDESERAVRYLENAGIETSEQVEMEDY